MTQPFHAAIVVIFVVESVWETEMECFKVSELKEKLAELDNNKTLFIRDGRIFVETEDFEKAAAEYNRKKQKQQEEWNEFNSPSPPGVASSRSFYHEVLEPPRRQGEPLFK